MGLPGKRIQKWREYLRQNLKQFEASRGIPYTTLKTLENNTEPGKHNPSYDVLAKLRTAFPQLNIDWLFDEGDTEPMLREGRALTPATPSIPDATSETVPDGPGPAGGSLRIVPLTLEEALEQNAKLRHENAAQAGRIATLEENQGWLRLEVQRKKTDASPNAAGPALHVSHSDPTNQARLIGPRFDDEAVMYIAA